MSLFGTTKVRGFEFSLYDKLFVGLFALLFVGGLWFGRSGWGARHVGGGVAWAAGYNLTSDRTAYTPYSPYGPVPESVAITIGQSTVQQYEQGQPNHGYHNVKVLKDYTYSQFGQIMVGQMSGGLGVGCQYCHLGANYAYDTSTKKVARNMILMTRYINSQIWWGGPHLPVVSCQTCHMGKPVPSRVENDPTTASYPIDPNALALAQQYSYAPGYPGTAGHAGNEAQSSVTTARLLLRTMAKMGTSLGVGCTFCHNSRNFASYEVQNKVYALTMVGMLQGIDTQYLGHIKLNGQQLPWGSCYMCHRAYQIPPGSVPYNSLYTFGKVQVQKNGIAGGNYLIQGDSANPSYIATQ